MLSKLAIYNYRSLRDLVIPLKRLNLVTGPNGSGKSNLYRALPLPAEIAQGRIIPSLTREGGIGSTLWAAPKEFSRSVLRGDYPIQGTVRKGPISLRLGFAGDEFAHRLIDTLQHRPDCNSIVLEKYFGQTKCAVEDETKGPKWQWPAR